MANGIANLYHSNSYTVAKSDIMGANSRTAKTGDFLKAAVAVSTLAAAGETILGVSAGSESGNAFASDNQTVAKERELYDPVADSRSYALPLTGQLLTFSGAIASGTIDLNVNGVAMDQISYDTSEAKTLGLVAAKLVSQFGTVIASATVASSTIKIVPIGQNNTVTITGIVATGITGSMSYRVLASTNENYYFDITTTGQCVNYDSISASSGQLQLKKVLYTGVSTSNTLSPIGEFIIANT